MPCSVRPASSAGNDHASAEASHDPRKFMSKGKRQKGFHEAVSRLPCMRMEIAAADARSMNFNGNLSSGEGLNSIAFYQLRTRSG